MKILFRHGFESMINSESIGDVTTYSSRQDRPVQPIVEMLLSTGRPVITSNWSILRFLRGENTFPSVVMLLLSYPKTKLETKDLEVLQQEASKKSHSEIVDLIETILVSRRKKSESEMQKVSVMHAHFTFSFLSRTGERANFETGRRWYTCTSSCD